MAERAAALELELGATVACTFCPGPGPRLVPRGDEASHQALHSASQFSCAACDGRMAFPVYSKVLQHVHSQHQVTDPELVRETVMLPVAGPVALCSFQCGVSSCRLAFTAQPEEVLRRHVAALHGRLALALGWSLLRHCRICGEGNSFGSEEELLAHIVALHPVDGYGRVLPEIYLEAEAEAEQKKEDVGSNDWEEAGGDKRKMSTSAKRETGLNSDSSEFRSEDEDIKPKVVREVVVSRLKKRKLKEVVGKMSSKDIERNINDLKKKIARKVQRKFSQPD